jgi:hypothetical protein
MTAGLSCGTNSRALIHTSASNISIYHPDFIVGLFSSTFTHSLTHLLTHLLLGSLLFERAAYSLTLSHTHYTLSLYHPLSFIV